MKKYLVILVLSLFSCNKDNHTLNLKEDFQVFEFPVNEGNWWRYKVIDLNNNSIDTLTISVSNESNVGEFFCDLIQNNQIVDSASIKISDAEIVYNGLNENYSFFGNFKLKFPINEGDSWLGFNLNDTVIVTSIIDEFTINNVKYEPVYNLKRSFFLGGGYSLTQFMIISPNVGVINQSIDLFDGLNFQKQNFDLIDFEIKE